MAQTAQKWYIVKHSTEICKIVPGEELGDDNSEIIEQWGPFNSQGEAIAHRIGLIRAGKCQPQ
ncbi:DDE transposase family protein [Fortiea contorta]|uniref:DDE transposase family protein n=1 Tax=Fortiea contorta TaxID=1892405 RepID=UPI00034D91B6|nr:DDE transposase family protein [Fortiea contorta]